MAEPPPHTHIATRYVDKQIGSVPVQYGLVVDCLLVTSLRHRPYWLFTAISAMYPWASTLALGGARPPNNSRS